MSFKSLNADDSRMSFKSSSFLPLESSPVRVSNVTVDNLMQLYINSDVNSNIICVFVLDSFYVRLLKKRNYMH